MSSRVRDRVREIPRDYLGVAKSQLRWVPLPLRVLLIRMDLWGDVEQTLEMSAWESALLGENIVETSNRAQRNLYQLLRAYGFRRPRGAGYFVKREEAYEDKHQDQCR